MQNHHMDYSDHSVPKAGLFGQVFWSAWLGEEKPRNMLILLTIFVGLLHVWLLVALSRQTETEMTEAKPLIMEVSMIAIPAPPKPVAAPPKPTPPPPEKKPLPPKPKPKPKSVVPAPAPVKQDAPDFAPFKPEPIATPQPPAEASSSPTSTAASTSTAQAVSDSAPAFTEANFRANYAHNPKPDYPAIARSRGWQGKVLLRVKVSAQGLSEAVSVEQSSGHDILDESAMQAVQKWRFIPAKRGETPVASSVIVPIDFKLRN